MTEYNPAPEAAPLAEPLPSPESQPSSESPPAPTARRQGLPPWLPYLLLAVVPAAVVGILVYAFAGGGGKGGGDDAAGILEGFFAGSLSSHAGELPTGFPEEFPIYGGAKIVASFAVEAEQGTNYIAVFTTSASTEAVYKFYSERLDEEPWQVEVESASEQGTGFGFSRPDDADIQGSVTIYHSGLADITSIYVSFRDFSLARAPQPEDKAFQLSQSLPLPQGFPEDLPIYQAKSSVVLDTYVERSPGSRVFIISFLTKDSQNDVIDFYTEEFSKRGWTVNDSATGLTGFALGIDFSEGTSQSLTGRIQADDFDQDDAYTKVDLYVQVSSSRGRGN